MAPNRQYFFMEATNSAGKYYVQPFEIRCGEAAEIPPSTQAQIWFRAKLELFHKARLCNDRLRDMLVLVRFQPEPVFRIVDLVYELRRHCRVLRCLVRKYRLSKKFAKLSVAGMIRKHRRRQHRLRRPRPRRNVGEGYAVTFASLIQRPVYSFKAENHQITQHVARLPSLPGLGD